MVTVQLVECSQVIANISTSASGMLHRIYRVLPLPETVISLGYVRKEKKLLAEAAKICGKKTFFFY